MQSFEDVMQIYIHLSWINTILYAVWYDGIEEESET